MPALDSASVLRPARDLRFRRVDDEAVVVRQRAGEVVVMNETAARLLELADGRTSVAGWVEALAAEYEVDREALARDVLAFAADLAAQGMLEVAPVSADEKPEEKSRGV
jgi:Coenzyme PQQ synthesis protein D (PqqD)